MCACSAAACHVNKLCCADARAQHPGPKLRCCSDCRTEREAMAGPAARRSRAAMTAKAALLTTAVLVGTAWGGVSAFVVQPQGSVPPRSGVAGPRSLAGRLQGVRVGRDHLPGRRGCTGSCGRLVSCELMLCSCVVSASLYTTMYANIITGFRSY